MECYNLQRQAACLKRSLFDQACILFFSSIVVEKIMWFVFVQVLQYSYQYILCAIGATHFFFFFFFFEINSLLRLCNSTFQSFLSMIYLCYLLFSFEQGVEISVHATLLFNPFCLSFCSHFILVDRKLRKTWNSKCWIKCVDDIYIEFRIPLDFCANLHLANWC